jgi:putative Mg2+ transporter-C (MgtC) family protein
LIVDIDGTLLSPTTRFMIRAGWRIGPPVGGVVLGRVAVGSYDMAVVVRLLVAFGLSYALGFERSLRGSPAGDRTFSLVGVGTAIIGIISAHGAPWALAGAVTGVGFIGGGLTFRQATRQGEVLLGLTTAAGIFAAAAIGAAAGYGSLLAATVGTAIVLVILELQHIPGLRMLDARRWSSHFADDETAGPFPHTEQKPPRPPTG